MTETKKRCPKPKYLAGFAKDLLNAEQKQTVAKHLESCSVCRMIVDGVKNSFEKPSNPSGNKSKTGVRTGSKAGERRDIDRPASAAKAKYGNKLLLTMLGILLMGGGIAAGIIYSNNPDLFAKNAGDPQKNPANTESVQERAQPLQSTGFVMGKIDGDEPIRMVRVTLKPAGETPIDEAVDLHLGFGFPIRLRVFDQENQDPVFAAFPTSSSLMGPGQVPAGKETWFEFDCQSPTSTDPLKSSPTLLSGLTVGDIQGIGFATPSSSNWSIESYRIEINGELYASNDAFLLGPESVKSEYEQVLTELVPMHDVLNQDVADLESVMQSGLGNDLDQEQLMAKREQLAKVAGPVQKMGGQLLGYFPCLIENDSRLPLNNFQLTSEKAPETDSIQRLQVILQSGGSEHPGTQNPVYLMIGGKKFLMTSEIDPLSNENQEQVFELGPSDLSFSPLKEADLDHFGLGVIGSNQPFSPTPDQANLQRVAIKVDDTPHYDSELKQDDRNSLEKITLVPESHRDNQGIFVSNQLDPFQRSFWKPGMEIPQAADDLPPQRKIEPEVEIPVYHFDDDSAVVALENDTVEIENNAPPTDQETRNQKTQDRPQRLRPLPSVIPPIRSQTNARRDRLRAGLRLAELILDKLLNQKQPTSQRNKANQKPSTANKQKKPANSKSKGRANRSNLDRGNSKKANTKKTNQKKDPNPKPVPTGKKLQIAKVQLSRLQQRLLIDGMAPTVEWNVANDQQVVTYQARLYAVLPHTSYRPVLIARSGRIKKSSNSSLTFQLGSNGKATAVSTRTFKTTLSPIDLAGIRISSEEKNRLCVQPEVVAFDKDGKVIQTGFSSRGGISPLLTKPAISSRIQFTRGFQVGGKGYDIPEELPLWSNFNNNPLKDGKSASLLKNPTNAHNALTFLPQPNSYAVSCWNSDVIVRSSFVNIDLVNNFRIVGYVGFIDGKVDQRDELSISAEVVIRNASTSMMDLAPAHSTTISDTNEVLRLASSEAIKYEKTDAKTPLLLIDIPIELGKSYEEYNSLLANDKSSPLNSKLSVDPIHESNLPVNGIRSGTILLNIKVKSGSRHPNTSVGLFGFRLVTDANRSAVQRFQLPPAPRVIYTKKK